MDLATALVLKTLRNTRRNVKSIRRRNLKSRQRLSSALRLPPEHPTEEQMQQKLHCWRHASSGANPCLGRWEVTNKNRNPSPLPGRRVITIKWRRRQTIDTGVDLGACHELQVGFITATSAAFLFPSTQTTQVSIYFSLYASRKGYTQ